jgi:hypothetical protein
MEWEHHFWGEAAGGSLLYGFEMSMSNWLFGD